jgi:hypothetical protein
VIITVNEPGSTFRRSYVLCLRSGIEEGTLLRRAKVQVGTYAGDLIANLHNGIFRRSIELKSDYRKYYEVEYVTFSEYVRKRFLFPLESVSSISAQFSQSDLIIHYHPGFWFLEDNEDNYGQDFLEKLLEPKRSK